MKISWSSFILMGINLGWSRVKQIIFDFSVSRQKIKRAYKVGKGVYFSFMGRGGGVEVELTLFAKFG